MHIMAAIDIYLIGNGNNLPCARKVALLEGRTDILISGPSERAFCCRKDFCHDLISLSH